MAWYIVMFLGGAAIGGSAVGWAMWNKMAQIKAALAKAEQAADVIRQ